MDTLMNWLAFAALVYGLGVGAKRWPGPVATTRRLMSSRHQVRRSDRGDTSGGTDGDSVVSSPVVPQDEPDLDDVKPIQFAPGVYVAPDPRVRILRLPAGPVPLEQLTGAANTDAPDDGAPTLVTQLAERRRWVRARLDPNDPLQLSPVEIDRQGADLFGCAERTIQRDRERIIRQRDRGRRSSTR
jgi:hypothetical protein